MSRTLIAPSESSRTVKESAVVLIDVDRRGVAVAMMAVDGHLHVFEELDFLRFGPTAF